MNLNFDEATLRQVVSQVIFDQLLTEDNKKQLIQSAISDLLKEKEVSSGLYGNTKKVSIITEAFQDSAF